MANPVLDEALILLGRLQTINSTMSNYVSQSDSSEISIGMTDEINTFSDCIGMYAEKLEKILAELNAKGE